jgi:hypothetical protein
MRPGSRQMTDWLRPLLQRKPRKLAAVALANKMARMAWALMTSGEAYRRPPAVAGGGSGMTAVSSRNAMEWNHGRTAGSGGERRSSGCRRPTAPPSEAVIPELDTGRPLLAKAGRNRNGRSG